MSSNYFFTKWKETLTHLEHTVHVDLEYQETKAHDKKRCEAVTRLCGVLGEYIVAYNAALECLQHNLQVQKTEYLHAILKAITSRIVELKNEISKLECSNTQFLGHGLANHKLTAYDAELVDVPLHSERPDNVKTSLAEAFVKAEEKRELLRIAEEEAPEDEQTGAVDKWWDEDEEEVSEEEKVEKQDPETEEMKETRRLVSLIQSQERSRQVIRMINYNNNKRQLWEKELLGTRKPSAPLELRVRAAKLIQRVCRTYFEIKRRKRHDCQQDERIGIRLCGKVDNSYLKNVVEIKRLRCDQRKEFEDQWQESREKLKQDFIKHNADDFADDYRDFIREWLRKWFNGIHYFYDIPEKEEGGSVLIMKEETPEPTEWWDQYKAYLEQKKANKGKSSHQLKMEKMEAKRDEMMRRKEELTKKKLEDKLMRKVMKNPSLHPGFHFPESKKTGHILEVLEKYHKDWDEWDKTEALEVKKKFVIDIDKSNVYAEAKMEMMQSVDDEMRDELKVLKTALKTDYENNGEKFPEPMKIPKKRVKKKKRVKAKMSESIAEKLEDLAFTGILKEYLPKKLGDFLGDHNYAGDDQRCNYEPALQFCGETRSIWWDRCREATHGHRKVLLVGPRCSGKTLLVHILCTVNDAVLFELDLTNIHNLNLSPAELLKLVNSVVICARAAQPSVIYLKHIHRLFYRKVPPEEANVNFALLKRFLVNKLLKKINKADKITLIGSCVDPWVTNSNQLLKQFPVVVLVPDTSYSAVYSMLSYWLNDNHTLPCDLDINSLARALRGYSYGHLQEGLKNFLTAERIVKIAARGLFPMEIYDFFMEDKTKEKVEYEKYLKWYTEKTPWGKKEKHHIEEQLEFRLLSEKYAEKAEKEKKKRKPASGASSATTLPSAATD